MANFNVSNRYANAFLDSVIEKKVVEQVTEDMRIIEETLSLSKELRNYMASPVLDDDKKSQIMNAIFADKISKDSMNFLDFIISKKRVDIVYDIVKRFNEIRDDQLGIANAQIITAAELDEESKQQLKTQLEDYTDKKLRVNFKEDESIIGGFTVRVSDKIIDASLKNQLAKLRKTLLSEKVSIN